MQNDTIKLLRECNLGCKMAVNSLNQIAEFVTNPGLSSLIEKSIEQHKKIEKETSDALALAGADEKEPGAMTSAFAWVTTEMKLTINDGDGQAAKIIMNGCNMGIQTIGEKQNEFTDADKDACKLATDLIQIEETLMKELKEFL